MDRQHVLDWIAGYERAWRAAGTDGLARLFTEDVSYRPSPWRPAVEGLEALADFWEGAREDGEVFEATSEIVALDGDVAVVRVNVEYRRPTPARWRDLWVIRFAPDGRCAAFEEWPFAPRQRDGHE